mgnify:FL=1
MKPEQLTALILKWTGDGHQQLSLLPASQLKEAHCPSFPTSAGALLHGLVPELGRGVKEALLAIYPASHPMELAHLQADGSLLFQNLVLGELDTLLKRTQGEVALFVPALGPDTSFEAFQEIIGHLRAPDGCPWDRQQTHQTLRTHLLGETYETLAAMDANDPQQMVEEFGDLLLQIVLNAQVASETGDFNMATVLQGIHRKIVRRHPHVFGEVLVDGVGDVLTNWEAIKAEERKEDQAANGTEKPKGLLDGVPEVFPSLAQAQEIQDRAARVGFDWHEIAPVIAKVLEELDELQQAETPEEQEAELGDLLFAVVNLSRWLKVDAESALRATNQRFRRRFAYVEEQARKIGHAMSTMTLDEMDVFWNQAKALGL